MRFLILLLSLLFLAPPVADATVHNRQNVSVFSAKSPKPAKESAKKKKLGYAFAIPTGIGLGIWLSGTTVTFLLILGIISLLIGIVFGILYLIE
jgi:hypothetical protein